MSYSSSNPAGDGGNVWSGGSRGGSRGGGFSRSNDDNDDDQGSRGGSYRGSYGNNYPRGGGGGGGGGGSGGGYGFRRDRDNDGEVEIQKDAIYIQDLPRDVTREQIQDAFSTVGAIKSDDRSGGPKIWIYKDRNTGEGNGRATVTYEDDDTANRAISEYNDQHIDSIDATVRVQLAQRRPRTNDRGGYNSGRGYRGGRSSWDSNSSRQGFSSDGNRWGNSGRDFSDNRRGGGGGSGGGGSSGGSGGGFRGRGGGGESFRDGADRDGGAYRGGQYRGASRGHGGSSNYAPY